MQEPAQFFWESGWDGTVILPAAQMAQGCILGMPYDTAYIRLHFMYGIGHFTQSEHRRECKDDP